MCSILKYHREQCHLGGVVAYCSHEFSISPETRLPRTFVSATRTHAHPYSTLIRLHFGSSTNPHHPYKSQCCYSFIPTNPSTGTILPELFVFLIIVPIFFCLFSPQFQSPNSSTFPKSPQPPPSTAGGFAWRLLRFPKS